jgi:hypothetical protein
VWSAVDKLNFGEGDSEARRKITVKVQDISSRNGTRKQKLFYKRNDMKKNRRKRNDGKGNVTEGRSYPAEGICNLGRHSEIM